MYPLQLLTVTTSHSKNITSEKTTSFENGSLQTKAFQAPVKSFHSKSILYETTRFMHNFYMKSLRNRSGEEQRNCRSLLETGSIINSEIYRIMAYAAGVASLGATALFLPRLCHLALRDLTPLFTRVNPLDTRP